MTEIGPVPGDVDVPVDLERHWSILDQTKAEFAKSGRSGVVIFIEPDDEYRNKLRAFLAAHNTPATNLNWQKPFLVIEHATQAEALFNLVKKFGLRAELFTAK